jgi:hypothetical protein
MRVAGIVPKWGAYAYAVIAEGNTFVRAESYKIGSLPGESAEFVPGLKRKITTEDVDRVVRQLVALLTEERVEHVVIADQTGTPTDDIGIELVEALRAGGVVVEVLNAPTSRVRRAELAATFTDWNPPVLGARSFEWCAALLLSSVELALTTSVELASSESTAAPPQWESPAPAVAPAAPVPAEELEPHGEEESTAPAVPDVVQGHRVAGIDPGSRYVALAVAEGSAAPFKIVACETKKIEFSDAVVDDVATRVVGILKRYKVDHLVIEQITHAHVRGLATDLIRTVYLSATIAERVRAAGIKVTRVSQGDWRDRVAGRTKQKRFTKEQNAPIKAQEIVVATLQEALEAAPSRKIASKLKQARSKLGELVTHKDRTKIENRQANRAQYVKTHRAALARLYADFETDADARTAHDLDALGIALYGALPPMPSQPPKVRRAGGVRGPGSATAQPRQRRSSNHERRTAERAAARAERAAKGCVCGRRHVRTCPLYAPKSYSKST